MHRKSKSKFSQDAAYWILLARAQGKGLKFWQTRSHPIVVHNSLPAGCIEKVVSGNGDKTLYERLSTPQRAQKKNLNSVWNSKQQQQQQQDILRI